MSPSTRAFLLTKKEESRFLGDVQHLLIERLTGSGQFSNDQFFHPSELSKSSWCERAAYFKLKGLKPDPLLVTSTPFWRYQSIFDEGHMIHDKWQGYFWDLGTLEGEFYCIECPYSWWGMSPGECPKCGRGRTFLRYLEIPLHNSELEIYGHGDGIVANVLHEYKSVSEGTIRIENPTLLTDHTYKININGKRREFVDYEELWDSIRRPFPSHLRQGHIYVCLWNREHPDRLIEEIAYIYECKWNQKPKEFIVRYREERITELLEACRRVLNAVKYPDVFPSPSCSQSEDDGECGECKIYTDEEEARPLRSKRRLQRNVRQDGGGRQIRRLERRQSS